MMSPLTALASSPIVGFNVLEVHRSPSPPMPFAESLLVEKSTPYAIDEPSMVVKNGVARAMVTWEDNRIRSSYSHDELGSWYNFSDRPKGSEPKFFQNYWA